MHVASTVSHFNIFHIEMITLIVKVVLNGNSANQPRWRLGFCGVTAHNLAYTIANIV